MYRLTVTCKIVIKRHLKRRLSPTFSMLFSGNIIFTTLLMIISSIKAELRIRGSYELRFIMYTNPIQSNMFRGKACYENPYCDIYFDVQLEHGGEVLKEFKTNTFQHVNVTNFARKLSPTTSNPFVVGFLKNQTTMKYTISVKSSDNSDRESPADVVESFVGTVKNLKNNEVRTVNVSSDGTIHFQFTIYLKCSAAYYGDHCSRECVSLNDTEGHYTCSDRGYKRCLHGWSGDKCNTLSICVKSLGFYRISFLSYTRNTTIPSSCKQGGCKQFFTVEFTDGSSVIKSFNTSTDGDLKFKTFGKELSTNVSNPFDVRLLTEKGPMHYSVWVWFEANGHLIQGATFKGELPIMTFRKKQTTVESVNVPHSQLSFEADLFCCQISKEGSNGRCLAIKSSKREEGSKVDKNLIIVIVTIVIFAVVGVGCAGCERHQKDSENSGADTFISFRFRKIIQNTLTGSDKEGRMGSQNKAITSIESIYEDTKDVEDRIIDISSTRISKND